MNTGWSGGYDKGARIKLKFTRAIVNAILDGSIKKAEFATLPIFGLQMPTTCPGVPAELLNPRNAWEDKDAYDKTLQRLAELFKKNDEKFEGLLPEAILNAGPKL